MLVVLAVLCSCAYVAYNIYRSKKIILRGVYKQPVGTHVIISGGSKGIGKELAIRYSQLGCHVTIIARNEKDLAEAKSEIERFRKNITVQKIRAVSCDLTAVTPEECDLQAKPGQSRRNLLDRILGEHDRCDILVNCCGASTPARFDDLTVAQFEHMMQVNFYSALKLTKLLLPVMKSRSIANQNNSKPYKGHIVFVSSVAGLLSFYGFSAYSASKFALVGLAQALNMELAPFDIGVTVAFPPDTNTPGFEEENKTKPRLCALMSDGASVLESGDVAQAIFNDVRDGKFHSTLGLESRLVLVSQNSFMPKSSINQVILESLLAAPCKLIAYSVVKGWYKLVDRHAAEEVSRSASDILSLRNDQ